MSFIDTVYLLRISEDYKLSTISNVILIVLSMPETYLYNIILLIPLEHFSRSDGTHCVKEAEVGESFMSSRPI